MICLILAGLSSCKTLKTETKKIEKNKQEIRKAERKSETVKRNIYILNYKDGVKPVLTLNNDNTFELSLNLGDGMIDSIGSYKANNNGYELKIEKIKLKNGYLADGSFSGIIILLKKISEKKMLIENDVYRVENGRKLSFCSPVKGEIFERKF